MRLDGIHQRTRAIVRQIDERRRPKPVLELPFVFLADDGSDWPGCEASNALAYEIATARGIAPQVYMGLDPDDEGSEP